MLQKLPLLRFNALFAVPFLCAALVFPRLYFLQVVQHEKYVQLAHRQQGMEYTLSPSRGRILDRSGHELAASTMLKSAYVTPSKLTESTAANLAHQLSPVLHLDFDKAYSILTGRDNRPLARQIEPAQYQKVLDIISKFPKEEMPKNAVFFTDEGKRYYPRHDLASHIIGFTGMDSYGDNKGLEGVEKSYNNDLCGTATTYRSMVNVGQKALEPASAAAMAPTNGKTLVLTIDETIQRCAETAITSFVQQENADAGIALVYAVKTGEVLAMANCPSFSLDDVKNTTTSQRRNRCITDAIEPGSVMKIFTFASLFEDNKVTAGDLVDCMGGRWTMGNGRTIVDSHHMGVVPVCEVFANSSNVGSVKCASRMGAKEFWRHLDAFGFGETTQIDLPGEARGLLRSVDRWSGLSMSSIPIGYELQVTAIQVVAAAGAIANKGIYMQPHVVKEIRDYQGEVIQKIEPKELRRIVSPETSRKMLDLMQLVVLKGTGKKAALEDYHVGGKTGTTKKLDHETHVYTMKNYIGSFCGVAPLEDPEICIYVWMDNPRRHMYGGDVAAPVFKEIAETALKKLNVPVAPEVKPNTDEIVLEQLRNKIEKAIPEGYTALGKLHDDDVMSGCMPNLKGLTMREVQERLNKLQIPGKLTGTGYAIDQTPKPYETIEKGTSAHVTFGTREQMIAMLADEAARSFTSTEEEDHVPDPDKPTTGGLRIVRPGRSATISLEQDDAANASVPRRRNGILPGEPKQEEKVQDSDSFAARGPQKNGGKSSWTQWQKIAGDQNVVMPANGKKLKQDDTPPVKTEDESPKSARDLGNRKINTMYDLKEDDAPKGDPAADR